MSMGEHVFMAYWADEQLDGLFGSRPDYHSKRNAWNNAIEYLEGDSYHAEPFEWHDRSATIETKIRRMKKHGIDVGRFRCELQKPQ